MPDAAMPEPPARRRGRKPTVSLAQIVDVAIDVWRREPLTFALVAAALGVTPQAVHRVVGSRDELVVLAVAALEESLPRPTDEIEPRAYLEAEAWARWTLFLGYPGLLRERLLYTPQPVIRRVASMVDDLGQRGLELRHAVFSLLAVADLVESRARVVVDMGAAGDVPASRDAHLDAWPEPIAAAIGELFPTGDDFLRHHLDTLLDGLVQRWEASGTANL